MNPDLMAYILEIIYQIKLKKEHTNSLIIILKVIYLEYKRTIQLGVDIFV